MDDQQFVNVILKKKYAAIILLECWISQNDKSELPSYNSYTPPPRINGKGGGIVIFVKRMLDVKISTVVHYTACNTVEWLLFENKFYLNNIL